MRKSIENYSKETGIPVSELIESRDKLRSVLGDDENGVIVPDFGIYYFDQNEYKVIIFATDMLMHPWKYKDRRFDKKSMSKYMMVPYSKIGNTIHALISMGIVHEVSGYRKAGVPRYAVDFKAFDHLDSILSNYEEENFRDFRTFIGLKPVFNISKSDLNDFDRYLSITKNQ